MAKLITLPVHQNNSGKINVVEKILPFQVKRVYWIYDILQNRGGHSHKITRQAVISIKGHCNILVKKKNYEKSFYLNSNTKLLILEPEDWHLIRDFSKDLILLVFASEEYDINDYIDDPVI